MAKAMAKATAKAPTKNVITVLEERGLIAEMT